jgi:hypothetical protein
MNRAWLVSLPLLLTLGCTPKDDDGFGSGGTAYTGGTIDEGDTSSEVTDTGDTGIWGDWPVPEDENGPSQRNPNCFFDDYPNIGEVIACEVEVWDQEGDTSGGDMELKITGGDFGETGASDTFDVGGIDDGADAYIEDDILYFAIQGIEDTDAYEVTWTLRDKAGNRSNELSVEMD